MSENGALTIYHIRQAAAERPNHVHSSICTYVAPTNRGVQPNCLVGVGLWRAGLINAKFRRDDRNHLGIRSLQHHFGFDANEISWLNQVQHRQDGLHTWAKAVEWADTLHPLTPVRESQIDKQLVCA